MSQDRIRKKHIRLTDLPAGYPDYFFNGEGFVTNYSELNKLIIEKTCGVFRIIMNDQHSRNALSEIMINQLSNAIGSALVDSSSRVIIISAMGKVFCAGHDLKEITAARSADDKGVSLYQRLFSSCSSLMESIVNSEKPIIAEVAGVATAAGCQLVASCDLALASISARFATPGVNIGLFCSTPMVALSRSVKRKHAMEMLLTGDMISAEKAAEIGLVNRVCSDEMLIKETNDLAVKIASKSKQTIAIGKRTFDQQAALSLKEAYVLTSNIMSQNLMTLDAEEGVGAFLGKRSPKWVDD